MNRSNVWRRSLKALHEIGSLGLGGGLAACLVINLGFRDASSTDFLAARAVFAAIADYVLFPSLAIVILSGLLAIGITRGFHDAGWAWIKALLGLSLFEATLLTIGAGRRQAELAAAALDPAQVATLLHAERNTVLILIGLCVVNVLLAVWRPKIMITIR